MQSEAAAEAQAQLATMLVEAHAQVSSLLEAGVRSKEIFAMVVNQIMNKMVRASEDGGGGGGEEALCLVLLLLSTSPPPPPPIPSSAASAAPQPEIILQIVISTVRPRTRLPACLPTLCCLTTSAPSPSAGPRAHHAARRLHPLRPPAAAPGPCVRRHQDDRRAGQGAAAPAAARAAAPALRLQVR